MSFSFIPLGVGDAFSARYYSSCLAVEADGQWLLIDCPHPIRKILRESGTQAGVSLDIGSLIGTVLTHVHADHASGLEGLGYFGKFALKRRPVLLAHPDVQARLWAGSLAAGMEHLMDDEWLSHSMTFEDYFDYRPLDMMRSTQIGPFTIESRFTIHHVPTTALRIYAGGRCLAYSADTAYDDSLIAWLSAGDVMIHETNHGTHTPYSRLAALPLELRGKMRLIHYPDEFNVDDSVIEPLVQGRRYTV